MTIHLLVTYSQTFNVRKNAVKLTKANFTNIKITIQ